MISAWWLLLIIPLAATAGAMCMSMAIVSREAEDNSESGRLARRT